MGIQQHELQAFLGNDHGLTGEQFADLMRIADEIGKRHPGRDYETERTAALVVAYRVMIGDDVVTELAEELAKGRSAELAALAGLQQAALSLIPETETEAGFARKSNIDRMTVRKWLGKR